MAFDKYTKEFHEETEKRAGPKTATLTFWMTFVAYWCVGLAIIIGTVVLAAKFLIPYVSFLSRLPLPQVGNVVLSFAIAVAVVGFAGVWVLKTFRRTRDGVVKLFADQLNALNSDVGNLQSATDSRISELLTVFSGTADRLHHLESHAASVASTNAALVELHERVVPVEHPPDDARTLGDLTHWALLKRLNTPSAHSVGHPLTIDLASYGVDAGRQMDVTELVRRSVKDNTVRLAVNNATMGADPQWGARKQLRVLYVCDGVKRQVTVPEDGELKLPE
jgi:hypothetical protein